MRKDETTSIPAACSSARRFPSLCAGRRARRPRKPACLPRPRLLHRGRFPDRGPLPPTAIPSSPTATCWDPTIRSARATPSCGALEGCGGSGAGCRRYRHVEPGLVAFSTELDYPRGRFGAGRPAGNQRHRDSEHSPAAEVSGRPRHGAGWLAAHRPGARDRRLPEQDGHHLPKEWLKNPELLFDLLHKFKVDIWISTESTELQGRRHPDPRRRPAFGRHRHRVVQPGRLAAGGRAGRPAGAGC